jgi:hypothetical protein
MRAQIDSAGFIAATFGAQQHGIVTREQLLRSGVASSTISRWVAAGHLHKLYPGIYAVGHANLSREGHWLAGVLAGGPDAALSHSASLLLQRVDRSTRLGTIHISVPNGCKRSPAGVIVHRPRRLERVDLRHYLGIRTTTPTRALFDLAPSLSPRRLRELFERCEYLDVLDRPRLAELLESGGRHALRDLLAYEPLPLAEVRSRLEGIVLSTCRTHSLPLPLTNVPVLDYEVDFFWPAARFIVEADGGQHRGERRERDNSRDITTARAGHLTRRYTEFALADEAAVAGEVASILTERLASPSPSA